MLSLPGSKTLKVYFVLHFSSFCGQTFEKPSSCGTSEEDSARTRGVRFESEKRMCGLNEYLIVNFDSKQTNKQKKKEQRRSLLKLVRSSEHVPNTFGNSRCQKKISGGNAGVKTRSGTV